MNNEQKENSLIELGKSVVEAQKEFQKLSPKGKELVATILIEINKARTEARNELLSEIKKKLGIIIDWEDEELPNEWGSITKDEWNKFWEEFKKK